MEGLLICRHCQTSSSLPPTAQSIHCRGCNRLVLVLEDDQDSDNPNTTKDLIHDQENNIKTETKGFTSSIKDIFSGCNISPYNETLIRSTFLAIDTSKPPPRGKRAFLCGITYKKQKNELKGSAHDLKNIKDLLVKRFDFPDGSILVLAEEEKYRPPTRKNIEEGLKWLVRGIQPGDSLVFYFSGHGLRQRDMVLDELDGFDETICPLDFQTNGMILDNFINETIVRPLIPDVTLHAIVDSCHSGTILDLPNVYNASTGKWESNSPPSGVYKGTSGGKAICFSACEDYQLAADTSALSPDKRMAGAMTSSLLNAIREADSNHQNITYADLIDSMTEALTRSSHSRCHTGLSRIFRPRILQDPLLSSSEEFSTSREFRL